LRRLLITDQNQGRSTSFRTTKTASVDLYMKMAFAKGRQWSQKLLALTVTWYCEDPIDTCMGMN